MADDVTCRPVLETETLKRATLFYIILEMSNLNQLQGNRNGKIANVCLKALLLFPSTLGLELN